MAYSTLRRKEKLDSFRKRSIMLNKKIFKKVGSIALAMAVVVSSITYSPEKVKASVTMEQGTNGWNLVWSDEFDQNVGGGVDGSTWNYDTGHGYSGWGNNEVQNYTTSTNNVYITNMSDAVDGKALAIKAKRENGEITSGRIRSDGKFYGRYGRYEARIKMSGGMRNGVWPAFWMMGNNTGLQWPSCGEIDIMEHRNQERDIIGTIHWGDPGNGHLWYGSETGGGFGQVNSMDDWHTYAVEWFNNGMKFYLDGQCYETLYYSAQNQQEEFNRAHYLLLNLAIGSNNSPFTKGITVDGNWQESTMFVDYVRVYQGNDGEFQRNKTKQGQVATQAPEPYTACTRNAEQDLGFWHYYVGDWANANARYEGGKTQNDPLTFLVKDKSTGEWGMQVLTDEIAVEQGQEYEYSVTVNSNKASGEVLFKNDKGDQNLGTKNLVKGDTVYSGTFKPSQNVAKFVFKLDNVEAGTTLKFKNFSLKKKQVQTQAPTQAPEPYTACVNNAEQDLGFWHYYIGDWANASARYDGGGTQNGQFLLYVKNKSTGDWGVQVLTDEISVEEGQEYEYSVTVNSNKASGEVLFKNDKGDQELGRKNLVNGDTVYSGTFRPAQNIVKFAFKLDAVEAGTTLKFKNLTLKKKQVQTQAPTTVKPTQAPTTVKPTQAPTQKPTQATGTNVDYDKVEFLGDGAQGGALSNTYKAVIVSGDINGVVNIQSKDGISGIYTQIADANIGKTTVNGKEVSEKIEGAGMWINIADLTKKDNEVIIYNADGSQKGVLRIYNKNGTDDGQPATQAPTTAKPTQAPTTKQVTTAAPTTVKKEVPAKPTGLVKVGKNEFQWNPVDKADIYYIYMNGEKIGEINSTMLVVTGFPSNGKYTLGVTAVNNDGESEMATLEFNYDENETTAQPTQEPTSVKPTQTPTTEKATTQAPTTQAPTTAKPTQAPTTQKVTQAPTTQKITQEPTTQEPTTQAPTQKPTTIQDLFPLNPTEVTVSNGLVLWNASARATGYEVFVDNIKVGETSATYYALSDLAAGEHSVSVRAVNNYGKSGFETTTYTVEVKTTEVVTTQKITQEPTTQQVTQAPTQTQEVTAKSDYKSLSDDVWSNNGNWSIYAAYWGGAGAKASIKESGDLLSIKLDEINGAEWSVQALNDVSGLEKGKEYKYEIVLNSTKDITVQTKENNSNSELISNDLIAGKTQTVTGTFISSGDVASVLLELGKGGESDAVVNIVSVKVVEVVKATENNTTQQVTSNEATTEVATQPSTQLTTQVATTKNGSDKAPTVAKASVKKATKKKSAKKIKITLKKITNASGYQVQISKSKKFKKVLVKKTIKKLKLVKKAVFTVKSSKIKNKKKLWVRARAYIVFNGKVIYGSWSKAKKAKVK